MPDFHNLNEVMAELDKVAVRTEQGVFFKESDVKRLFALKDFQDTGREEAEGEPKPKTLAEARAAVMSNKDLVDKFMTPEAEKSALRVAISQ